MRPEGRDRSCEFRFCLKTLRGACRPDGDKGKASRFECPSDARELVSGSILSIRLSRFRGPRPPPSLASGARKYFTGRLRSCQRGHEIFTTPLPRRREPGPAQRYLPASGKGNLSIIHAPRESARGNFRLFFGNRPRDARGRGAPRAGGAGPRIRPREGGRSEREGAGAGRAGPRGAAGGRRHWIAGPLGRSRQGALLAEGSRSTV